MLLASFGCASLQPGYESWVGHRVGELIAAWGEPDRRSDLNEGYVAYTWAGDTDGCELTFVVLENRVHNFTTDGCPGGSG